MGQTKSAAISIEQHAAIQKLFKDEYGFSFVVEPWPSRTIMVYFETQKDADTFHELMMLLAKERPELFRVG